MDFLKKEQHLSTVIRPSSKGINHLALTLKFLDDIYLNVDILEKDKKDQFSLGSKLEIDGINYEDIDEIIARYVNPLLDNVRLLTKYKKFENIQKEKVPELLKKQKNASVGEFIPYVITPDETRSGKFILYYQPGKHIKKEPISVTGEGFLFTKKVFNSVNKLINAFKKSYQETPVDKSNW